jgi:hypothetical protein
VGQVLFEQTGLEKEGYNRLLHLVLTTELLEYIQYSSFSDNSASNRINLLTITFLIYSD